MFNSCKHQFSIKTAIIKEVPCCQWRSVVFLPPTDWLVHNFQFRHRHISGTVWVIMSTMFYRVFHFYGSKEWLFLSSKMSTCKSTHWLYLSYVHGYYLPYQLISIVKSEIYSVISHKILLVNNHGEWSEAKKIVPQESGHVRVDKWSPKSTSSHPRCHANFVRNAVCTHFFKLKMFMFYIVNDHHWSEL